MKVFHLTSGVLHSCDDIGGRFIRSEAVEENIDLYACSATFGKSLRQLVRYRAVFVKILCERDRGLRTSYLAQHTGKSFIAVEQNFDPVPADDRCFGIGFMVGKKVSSPRMISGIWRTARTLAQPKTKRITNIQLNSLIICFKNFI